MRELLMGSLALGGVSAGVYYNIDSGTVYNQSVDQVANELEDMEIPADLKLAAGMEITASRDGLNSVKWTFSAEGNDIAVFTANLSAEGATQTRVKVDFKLADSSVGDELKKTPLSMAFARSIAKIALAEQVDATLGHHEYDQRKVANAMVAYAISHPGEVAMFGSAMDRFKSHADPEAWAEMSEALERDFPDWDNDRGLSRDAEDMATRGAPEKVLDAEQQVEVGQMRAAGASAEEAERDARH